MANLLTTVRDKCIAITGRCWLYRRLLVDAIEKAGGTVTTDAEVTRSTDVLVRGTSQQWKHEEFGRKELAAAKFIREGQQISIVHDIEFRKLIEEKKPARCVDHVAGDVIAWLGSPPSRTAYNRIAALPGSLDREHTARGRLEQRYLRDLIFQERDRQECALCGREFPIGIMVAAHIKPRSECSTEERRDAACIAFGVCLVGCDVLYERGFVSVAENGQVVTVLTAGLTKALREQLRVLRGRKCQAWHAGTQTYFAWHHARRFVPHRSGTVLGG